MANNPQNIMVSNDAVITIFEGLLPKSEWPKTVGATLPTGGEEVGLTTSDGEETTRTVETTAIDAHQMTNARTLVTTGAFTIALSALESNEVSKKLYYGSAAVAGVTEIETVAWTGTVRYDTFDTQAGYEKAVAFFGWATVTPNGAVTYSRTGAAVYPLLFTFQGTPIMLDD